MNMLNLISLQGDIVDTAKASVKSMIVGSHWFWNESFRTNEYAALIQVISHPAAITRVTIVTGTDNLYERINSIVAWHKVKYLFYVALIILAFTVSWWFVLACLVLLVFNATILQSIQTQTNIEIIARLFLLDAILNKYPEFASILLDTERDRNTVRKEAGTFLKQHRQEIMLVARNLADPDISLTSARKEEKTTGGLPEQLLDTQEQKTVGTDADFEANITNMILMMTTEYLRGGDNQEIEADMKLIIKTAEEHGEEAAKTLMMGLFAGREVAMCQEGCDSDKIPDGYGEFGLTVTNPIPVEGISASDIYLHRLRTIKNEKVTWTREGSSVVENIKHPIDEYSIMGPDGDELATIYISPYHKQISKRAPKGFLLIEE